MVPDGNGVDRVTTDSKLGDLARVVRSKDAGNFHLTFDIIFEDPDTFARVLDSGVITEERIRELYRLPPDDSVDIIIFNPGLGIKVVIPRHFSSGGLDGVGEADLFGSNQHMPLLDILVPERNS
jgi:hypothetical protein